MMGPTVLDVCHLLGFPVDGEIITHLIEDDPTFTPGKYDSLYSAFIDREFKDSAQVTDREPFCCILFWLCKFVFCVLSSRITYEFVSIAKSLALGNKLALASYFLGHVYKVYNDLADNPSNSNIGGPMWFIQMWILAYFKEFHRFTTFPIHQLQNSYGVLYASATFHRMSFETCLQFFYTQPRDIHDDFFSLFVDARLLISWVRDLIATQTLSPIQSGAWFEILSAKEIFLGTFHANYKKCSSEIYCPAQFAR